MGQYLIDALRDGLPAEVVVDDPDRVESFRFDKAQFCPAGIPAAVVLVRERAHVEHTLRTASRLGVPVVPQGARSGLSGAANAIDGCVVLSLERMDHIVEIDPANRIAVIDKEKLQLVESTETLMGRLGLRTLTVRVGDKLDNLPESLRNSGARLGAGGGTIVFTDPAGADLGPRRPARAVWGAGCGHRTRGPSRGRARPPRSAAGASRSPAAR